MSALDKQIKGSNLCGTKCSEKNTIIHPETNVGQVLLVENTSVTLEDWILSLNDESSEQHLSSNSNLLEWLRENYPIPSTEVLPATDTKLGGIKLGEDNAYLSIDINGILTVKESALPTIQEASYASLGVIRLGQDISIMSGITFPNQEITGIFSTYRPNTSKYYCFPLMFDDSDNHHTGIAIPQELFKGTQKQSNWTELDTTSPTYILNKPELHAVATSGNYNDLTNRPTIPTAINSEYSYTIHKDDFTGIDDLLNIVNQEVDLGIGNNRIININILGSLTPKTTNEDIPYLANIEKFINAQYGIFEQALLDRNVYTNIKLNLSFIFDTAAQVTDIPFNYIKSETNNYYATIIGDSSITYDSEAETCTIVFPQDRKCTISFNYTITKAYLDLNNNEKVYSTIWEYKVEECKTQIVNYLNE